jgi:glucuronokinase
MALCGDPAAAVLGTRHPGWDVRVLVDRTGFAGHISTVESGSEGIDRASIRTRGDATRPFATQAWNPPGVRPARASAPARAALAGNPSDGYGGRTLALALPQLEARVELVPAAGLELGRASSEPVRLAGLADLDRALKAGREPALLAAVLRRLGRVRRLPEEGFALRVGSSVPPEVGLAASSAIVVAALRVLCQAFEIELTPDDLAAAALEAETEELGIAAGPQDRVVQAHGGLVMMDFAPPSGAPWSVELLDPALLPPLFVAWRRDAAAHSGEYHAELRRRHAGGDASIHVCMRHLAQLASDARDALLADDHEAFARCMDGSFDERRSMGPLVPAHERMVEVARALGASANYAGSGGAIVGTLPPGGFDKLRQAFAAERCAVMRAVTRRTPPLSPP